MSPRATFEITTAMKTKTLPTNPYRIDDQVTVCGYSDRKSFTVIASTPTTITIQENKRTLLNGFDSGEPDALVMTPGGFLGHTEGEQRWMVERDTNGSIIKAHMQHTPQKVWTEGYAYVERANFKSKMGKVIPGSHDFYDFNF